MKLLAILDGRKPFLGREKFVFDVSHQHRNPSFLLSDDDQKAELNKLLEMEVADLEAAIKDGEKKIEDAEETFKTELQKLQDQYQELMKTKEDTIAEVKSSGLGRMKSVLAHRSKGK